MNKLFESVNDLFESDIDLVNVDDSIEETLEEAISRAHEEELGAIGTYDTILSKIEEGTNEALVEMINEIKKDEEDHELLLKHYIETGEVWTDEDLKKDKESEDEDEESEDESSINEDYRDDVIRDLGIESGSDEEAQVDEILNTVPTVYDVFTLSQVGSNEYKSDLYTTVEDEDQAYDIVAELGAQGINAFVESRDSNEDVIVPNNFLSGLYARDLNESTEGLSKEDKICRLEDKIKECRDRIEEINNTKSFDDGSYEAGLDLEDKAIERAWLERTISEYQKEIDELKGETITEGSKSDLYSIRGEIRDDETGRLMLHTRNKNTGLVGCANFFGNGDDKVIVYEGKGDGSDDKEMGFDEFLANYDYVLADEDGQSFGVTEASSVDGLVTKFKELPYGDFKASNAIGVLNDGTVFWADDENDVYSVPCSYAELKDAMYNKEQDDWMEFSQSFNRIEDPLATKILVAIDRNSEDVLDYQETFKDGLPF